MKPARLALVFVALLLAAGCGGDEETTTTDTGTEQAFKVGVYWLLDGKVWPALRQVEPPLHPSDSALTELLKGPSEDETQDLHFTTAIPADIRMPKGNFADGVLSLDFDQELGAQALAQLVYTLTQFPDIDSVRIDGKALTRGDFEDQTPAILVESPLAFEEVESPLRVTGTANTFEATFEYELTDTDGRIVDQDFVTATSGTGTRGTFDFTTADFTVPFDGIGALIVFERSAKDGSRRNLVEIPLKMEK